MYNNKNDIKKYIKVVLPWGKPIEGIYREYQFETLESYLNRGGTIRKSKPKIYSLPNRNPTNFKMKWALAS
jgi:hypothetical protein